MKKVIRKTFVRQVPRRRVILIRRQAPVQKQYWDHFCDAGQEVADYLV